MDKRKGTNVINQAIINGSDDGIRTLAAAIIEQTARDYVNAENIPGQYSPEFHRKQIIKFMDSYFYGVICDSLKLDKDYVREGIARRAS